MLVNCWSPALTSDHTPVMVRDHEGSWVRSEDWCARVRECQDLRDALATARNDALEEAKDVALDILAQDQDRFAAAKEIIAAIETLKSEEKP